MKRPHSLADHAVFRVYASALLMVGAASCVRHSDTPSPQESLRDVVELVSAETAATEDGQTRFTLTFRCTKPLEKNYRMLFHGYVKDESLIPPEKRNKFKFLNADHEPVKPTRTWTPGANIVHTVSLPLAAGEYNFHVGLFDRHTSKALLGKPFELGWMQSASAMRARTMNTNFSHQRSNVLVYGIGHSGTSIITRMLFALGWKEGGPPGCADEAFAEHIEVRECNRFALARGSLPERATELLASLEQPWALKIPRLVLTLPLWKATFLTGGLCLPLLLWVTRDLDEVKQSYSRRREFVRDLPGSHGHTVDELWDQAATNYAAWPGPKLQIDYADVAAATSLFVPRKAAMAPDEDLAGAAHPCS